MLNFREALASKKAINLYRDIQQYITIFQITNISTTEEVDRALRVFKKAAQQLTANSLFIGRESITPTIAKSNKDYNNQEDINFDNIRVYQVNQ